jgi:hypothetical protein
MALLSGREQRSRWAPPRQQLVVLGRARAHQYRQGEPGLECDRLTACRRRERLQRVHWKEATTAP